MIEDLIRKSIELNKRCRGGAAEILLPAMSIGLGVPTLKKGIYRECSPMLAERYEMFGRWQDATHGHWLSVDDMEALWLERIEDDLLRDAKINKIAAE